MKKFKIVWIFILFTTLSFSKSYKWNLKVVAGSLSPKDTHTKINNEKNVLQGISFYQNRLFVTQAVGKERILFNLLDKNGDSLANRQFNYVSHGQDLSIERVDDTHIYLYTSDEKNRGIGRFVVNLSQKYEGEKLDIKFDKSIKLGLKHPTVTLSEDKEYIVAHSRGKIRVYNKDTLLSGEKDTFYQFSLLKEQKKIWFQGILMYGDYIFTLSGNNRVKEKKIVVVYSKKGEVLDRFDIEAKSLGDGVDYTSKDRWELEGLSMKNGLIYTTINSTIRAKKNKQLLQILRVENR